jgi:uncharacterized protein YjbI with pentapeptide repeats
VFKAFKNKFVEFESKIPARFLPREVFSKEVYEFTKNFLEENKDKLSRKEKGDVLRLYIKRWVGYGCELHIKDTEYAEQYKEEFSNKLASYPSSRPMTAGFNLAGADLTMIDTNDIMFLSVNFKGANCCRTIITHSRFIDCNLSSVNTVGANLNQCKFEKSNLEGIILSHRITGVCLNECDLRNASLHGLDEAQGFSMRFSICNNSTTGLRKDLVEDSVRLNKVNQLFTIQNVADEKVMDYWMYRYKFGQKVPPLLCKVIDKMKAHGAKPSNIVDAYTVELEGKVVEVYRGMYQ